MSQNKLKPAYILSVIIATLMAVASASGLFTDLYRDNATVTAAWRGNDLVTLFVAVPLLIAGMIFLRGAWLAASTADLDGQCWDTRYTIIFFTCMAQRSINASWSTSALFSLSIYALIFGLGNIRY